MLPCLKHQSLTNLNSGDIFRPELVPEGVVIDVDGLSLRRQLNDGLPEAQFGVGVPHGRGMCLA